MPLIAAEFSAIITPSTTYMCSIARGPGTILHFWRACQDSKNSPGLWNTRLSILWNWSVNLIDKQP